MNMPDIVSLEDLIQENENGNSKIKLIGKAIAIFSIEILDNLDFENTDVNEYLSLVLAELTKHTFEYLLAMPLDKRSSDEIKKQIVENRLTQIMEQSRIDVETKH